MKNIGIIFAIVQLAFGSVYLAAVGNNAWIWMLICIAFLAYSFEKEETSDTMLDALDAASEAIHAFEDSEGRMPSETGEFRNLQAAVHQVDRAIAKEVA